MNRWGGALALVLLLAVGRVVASEGGAGEADAKPAPADAEPAVKLAAGQVITYTFAQATRNRFGDGNDRLEDERLTHGTLVLYVLEALADGGWRVALAADLEDAHSWTAPPERKPLKGRWRNVVILRLTAALQPAEGYEFGRAPTVGDASVEPPADAPQPPPRVPTFFPPLTAGDLARTEGWKAEVAALAPFEGFKGGRAEQWVARLKNQPDRLLFVRQILGEPVTYGEKFLLEPGAGRLVAWEFVYHMCGGDGNNRQETAGQEKSRATLDEKQLAAARGAAAELEEIAKLLGAKPAEAKPRLAALKAKSPESPFLPAIDAALAGLERAAKSAPAPQAE